MRLIRNFLLITDKLPASHCSETGFQARQKGIVSGCGAKVRFPMTIACRSERLDETVSGCFFGLKDNIVFFKTSFCIKNQNGF